MKELASMRESLLRKENAEKLGRASVERKEAINRKRTENMDRNASPEEMAEFRILPIGNSDAVAPILDDEVA